MKTIESIKSRLIDRILTSENESFLEAIENIFVSVQTEEIIALSSEQIEMLMMSDADIVAGNLISEHELEKLDKRWLG